MRYLLLVPATLFAIGVSSAHADPIPTFQVTDAAMFMRPNVVGDHIRFEFTGPGVDITGIGGMPCFAWCTGAPIPPGTGIGPTQIFISGFTRAIVGGISYSPNSEFAVSMPSFFDESGGLNPIATGFVGMGPTFSPFRMTMPTNGSWRFNFAPATDGNGNATTRFVSGTFSASALAPTPEPGTFGLMLAGSAGAAWISRRRRTSRDA